jgi:hypothetical protein
MDYQLGNECRSVPYHAQAQVGLVRLYHERWEIKPAYFALRHTLLDGHVTLDDGGLRVRCSTIGSVLSMPVSAGLCRLRLGCLLFRTGC